MDILADQPSIIAEETSLSYDDSVPYSELPPVETSHSSSSLAERISHTKVYLVSDAIATRTGKRKYEDNDLEEDMEEDVSDPTLRDNAILLHGPPISHVPTENIFAYTTHFDAHPIGLEWIDDTTCILVFSTKAAARGAFRYLAKSHAEEPSEEGFITAKPIPIAFWPPEERINKSLGKGEGLKGAIRMRWALTLDVKKHGARVESEFYKKYGSNAGKAGYDEERQAKKRRGELGERNEAEERAKLDEDLDAFLAEDPDMPPSPPSKMRADYVTRERHSAPGRGPQPSLESRLAAPFPRRGHRDYSHRREHDKVARNRREERPKKTQEDLDAELDAFLNSRD
ncbi:hypothetical protein BDY19DRAFT_925038 [Irpex rosettiformis]|uniref:Uncharacterized protein n=1 Tax=Irpex rosettiformis TaxID=378272 RepID=A0ACB8UEB5_9APHY|nr:hypothetical protein BDY19DRAFT_925038 [Irpex rosettiformis]